MNQHMLIGLFLKTWPEVWHFNILMPASPCSSTSHADVSPNTSLRLWGLAVVVHPRWDLATQLDRHLRLPPKRHLRSLPLCVRNRVLHLHHALPSALALLSAPCRSSGVEAAVVRQRRRRRRLRSTLTAAPPARQAEELVLLK